MSEFIRTTTVDIGGPWFFDRASLADLDKIISENWEKMEKKQDEIIRKEIEEEVSSRQARYAEGDERQKWIASVERSKKERFAMYTERGITLFFKNGRRLSVNTFDEAFHNPILENELVTGFSIFLKNKEMKCSVFCHQDKELSIDASPDRDVDAARFFSAVKEWAKKTNSPHWLWYWKPFRIIIFSGLFGAFIAFLAQQKDRGALIHEALRKSAYDLLRHGVSAQNQDQAVSLLLSLEVNYPPAGVIIVEPSWYLMQWASLFSVLLIACFVPNSHIGIGLGEEIIKRWRVWLKIMYVTIPIWLASTLLHSPLERLVHKIFGF